LIKFAFEERWIGDRVGEKSIGSRERKEENRNNHMALDLCLSLCLSLGLSIFVFGFPQHSIIYEFWTKQFSAYALPSTCHEELSPRLYVPHANQHRRAIVLLHFVLICSPQSFKSITSITLAIIPLSFYQNTLLSPF